jgi:hypothetical protein
MDFSDIFNLLIIGAVVVGPMVAKMKINKSKASSPGSADTGTGRRTSVPTKQGVSTRSATAKPTAPGQRTLRTRPIKPAKPSRRPAETALPVPRAEVAAEAIKPPKSRTPTPRVIAQPRRRRWTALQQAVILREMLDRPVALREGDRL